METPKIEKEAMWAESVTGENFQRIHIYEARIMETLLREARKVLDDWCEEYGHTELKTMRDKIDVYLDT